MIAALKILHTLLMLLGTISGAVAGALIASENDGLWPVGMIIGSWLGLLVGCFIGTLVVLTLNLAGEVDD